MFTILIIDKDPSTKELLESTLIKLEIKTEIFAVQTIDDSIPYFSKKNINLFLIFISDHDVQTVSTIQNLQYNPSFLLHPVVFVSDNLNNMIRCFKESYCLDYLSKPLNAQSFKKLAKYIHLHNQYHLPDTPIYELNYIYFNTPSFFLKLPVYQIIFIEYLDRKCIIHTYDEQISAPCPMKKLLSVIKGTTLIQSHRAFIVNLSFIRKIAKNEKPCTLYFFGCQETALLGRNFAKPIMDALEQRI